MSKHTLWMRKKIEVNTDPQRRCYNGCHAKSEIRWTAWGVMEFSVPTHKVESRLKFWRELNDYAVSQRGESARAEFTAPKETEVPDEPS